eukprot:5567785-Pyramimonas_sp.AAC.1
MVHTRPKRVSACPPGPSPGLHQSGHPIPDDFPFQNDENVSEKQLVKGSNKQLSDTDQYRLLREYNAILADPGPGKVAELCVKWGVGHNYPSRLSAKMNRTGSLMRVKRVRAPRKFSSETKDKLTEIATARGGDLTYKELTEELFKATGVKLHRATIWRYVRAEWKVVRKRIKPPLSEEQMASRLEFAQTHRRNTWDDWVDIDEKWFYMWVNKGTLKLPPGMKQQRKVVASRSHIPKVMFLSAIAKPRPEHNFDGLIGIWRVAEPYSAKKDSKYHDRGDVYDKDCTMDTVFYRKLMTKKVFPAIRRKMPWAKLVTIQQDGASPHTGKDNPRHLKTAGMNPRVPGNAKITILTQPSNSPDNNLNDLCFFPSMSARVAKCGHRTVDELVEMVEKEYWNYDQATLLRGWEMKTRVLGEIIKHKGNNDFELPHRKRN